MAKGASFMQYMRAHGNAPGPTQRPVLAGALTGSVAELPAAVTLWWSGALMSATQSLSLSFWLTLALHWLLAICGGAIYGRVFSRAANDRQGGWLFGISYGFLIWMIGPVTVLQWTFGRPLALGVAAMGILAAHLIYGLSLGLLFPWIHNLLQHELNHLKEPRGHGIFGIKPERH
ncbi:MAG: hypothetical protein ABR555_10915 [Pyrinomonadaceae bacterium]